jgi:hypothetical protein
MSREKFQNISYVQGETVVSLKANEPTFKKATCLDAEKEFYELEMAKKTILMDIPVQLAYFVLQYAKLRILSFYYDFIDRFINRSDFEYCEMDTDSAYIAFSREKLRDIIKPEMLNMFDSGLHAFCNDNIAVEADSSMHWFPRECCSKHAVHDLRTSGLFKLEAQGDEFVGLCSKTYILRSETGDKFSSKGLNTTSVKNALHLYKNVLQNRVPQGVINMGIVKKDNALFSYEQTRCGFTYLYCKRKVNDDGRTTEPLDICLKP